MQEQTPPHHSSPTTAELPPAPVPTLLVSMAWLAGYGLPDLPLVTTPDRHAGWATLVLVRLPDRPAAGRAPLSAPATLARLSAAFREVPFVAMATDDTALAALGQAGLRAAAVLDDEGGPAVLFRLAERLGADPGVIFGGEPAARARSAARLAALAGLSPASPARDARLAALRLALRDGGPDVPPLPAEAVEVLARVSGFGRSLAVEHFGVSGLPVFLSDAERRALAPDTADVAPLFHHAASALDLLRGPDPTPPGASTGGGALASWTADAEQAWLATRSPSSRTLGGAARPVLLRPPTHSSEPGEAAEILRHGPLSAPVPAVPAPEPGDVVAPLRQAFPWCEAAIATVGRELALARLGREPVLRLPPLLLLGPPGTGKTTFARELARLCGAPSALVACPDPSAVTTLAGNGRGWRAARACLPARVILEAGVRNPVVILDDVDRSATGDQHGTVPGVLLSMLEPGTAGRYLDPLLDAPLDLGAVLWVATANAAGGLPGALRDRMLVCEVPPPPLAALDGIVERSLRGIAGSLGAAAEVMPPVPPEVLDLICSAFEEDAGTLRRLHLALRAAIGAGLRGGNPAAAARDALRRPGPGAPRVGFQLKAVRHDETGSCA